MNTQRSLELLAALSLLHSTYACPPVFRPGETSFRSNDPAAAVVLTLGVLIWEGGLSQDVPMFRACEGKIIDHSTGHAVPDAVVIIRVPATHKLFAAKAKADGTFDVEIRERIRSGTTLAVSAFAPFYGTGNILTGSNGCQGMQISLLPLRDDQWRTFRSEQVLPSLRASVGPMWDVDDADRKILAELAGAVEQ